MRSLRHERASKRSEKIEALFSHPVDAGKYIVLRMGDNLRSHLRLETLFMRWDDRGLSPLLEVASAEPDVIDFFCKKAPTLERESAERGLKRYALKADPRSYGFALPSEQTNMEVLALSFDELTATLLEGMPDSITSQISGG
ncbi:hypothetical protein A5677_10970 [Mycobacterium malmoense]|uniref:Uncharacterized protein n=1 Tax=Mycobacterium malmoense TaxID=1780 RepID=A0A1B9DE85_MYCMA|nr:hypothetical protein A5677_10970 [Mycobacterium malmoense]